MQHRYIHRTRSGALTAGTHGARRPPGVKHVVYHQHPLALDQLRVRKGERARLGQAVKRLAPVVVEEHRRRQYAAQLEPLGEEGAGYQTAAGDAHEHIVRDARARSGAMARLAARLHRLPHPIRQEHGEAFHITPREEGTAFESTRMGVEGGVESGGGRGGGRRGGAQAECGKAAVAADTRAVCRSVTAEWCLCRVCVNVRKRHVPRSVMAKPRGVARRDEHEAPGGGRGITRWSVCRKRRRREKRCGNRARAECSGHDGRTGHTEPHSMSTHKQLVFRASAVHRLFPQESSRWSIRLAQRYCGCSRALGYV
eukprot:ctg_1324.g416